VVTLTCLFSSLVLLYQAASPWVEVVAEGWYMVHVQGSYSFLEEAGAVPTRGSNLETRLPSRWVRPILGGGLHRNNVD
jgi:hypothetical protein